jgi:hypothetical protein
VTGGMDGYARGRSVSNAFVPARPALAELQARHYALMADYAEVLRRGSRLPRFSQMRIGSKGRENLIAGQLVRALLTLQVTSGARTVADAYGVVGQTFNPDFDRKYAEWLAAAAAGCRELASDLSSWRFLSGVLRVPGFTALAGLALAALADSPAFRLIGLGLFAAALLINVGPPAWNSFRMKRELMLDGAYRYDRADEEEQKAHAGFNVYRSQRELAACLGRRWATEIQLDYLAVCVLGTIVLIVGGGLTKLEFGPIWSLLGLLPGLAIVGYGVVMWMNRYWR